MKRTQTIYNKKLNEQLGEFVLNREGFADKNFVDNSSLTVAQFSKK